MNAKKPAQGAIDPVKGLNMMNPANDLHAEDAGACRPSAAGAGMGRRQWLAGTATLAVGALLAGCGPDHDDDGFRRERVYLDDTGAGKETRLVVGQAIEIRLPIDPATGQTTAHTGKSSPEMRRDSGPERKVINGQTYDVWVFVAVVGGHATISLAYELPGQILRELKYPVDVHFN